MARGVSTTARRYAEAIFQIAERDKTIARWLEQLEAIAAAVSDDASVRRLENPQVPFEQRHEALREVLGKSELPGMANLLALVLRRRRLELVPDIAREYRRLVNRKEGIVEATAVSAAKLNESEVAALRQRLENMTGGNVELELAVDPALLGGVQVRIGDMLYDGSVRGRLERLRSRIVSGALTP